jgi:hypothetical protein
MEKMKLSSFLNYGSLLIDSVQTVNSTSDQIHHQL